MTPDQLEAVAGELKQMGAPQGFTDAIRHCVQQGWPGMAQKLAMGYAATVDRIAQTGRTAHDYYAPPTYDLPEPGRPQRFFPGCEPRRHRSTGCDDCHGWGLVFWRGYRRSPSGAYAEMASEWCEPCPGCRIGDEGNKQ